MKKTTTMALVLAVAALILDSRWAARSAQEALALCGRVLIPSLFPLFVVSGMLVPELQKLRIPLLSRLLGVPQGGESLWLLGCAGGFPTGAAAIAQAVRSGAMNRSDGERMLGLCSLCGPAFLFGVLPQLLPMREVIGIFVLQMQTSLLLAVFWPGASDGILSPAAESASLVNAVRRAVDSMVSVCAWVILAAVAAGFGKRWLFSFLPPSAGMILTGLTELTNGILALPEQNRFLLCSLFICFGGVSVLLQIGGIAADAGLRMGQCVAQKSIHALLGLGMAWGFRLAGPVIFFLPPLLIFAKIRVEIHGRLVYNDRERKGFKCCFGKRWSSPASTAATAPK